MGRQRASCLEAVNDRFEGWASRAGQVGKARSPPDSVVWAYYREGRLRGTDSGHHATQIESPVSTPNTSFEITPLNSLIGWKGGIPGLPGPPMLLRQTAIDDLNLGDMLTIARTAGSAGDCHRR